MFCISIFTREYKESKVDSSYAFTIFQQFWPSYLLSTIWQKSWDSVGWLQQRPVSLGPLFHVPHLRQFYFLPCTPPRCRRWRWQKGRQLSVRSGGQLWPRKSCSFRLRLLHRLHLDLNKIVWANVSFKGKSLKLGTKYRFQRPILKNIFPYLPGHSTRSGLDKAATRLSPLK